MNQFKRILVTVDTRLKHHPIIAEAVEIAEKNGATLKLMDVIPEIPWLVRMTISDHKELQHSIEKEKQQALDELAKPIRAQDVEVETKVSIGKTSTEIVREVVSGKHDLVVGIAKGKGSSKRGYFGQTATQLLRSCPCALWLVAPGTKPKFNRILGCVDTASEDPADVELNDKIFKLATDVGKYHNGSLSILHAWSLWNEPMLRGRMEHDDFTNMEKLNLNEETRLLDEFLQKHGASASDDNVYMFKGEVDEIIAGFIRRKEIDLVVMGTVARSGISGAITGNTAEKILGLIECSVLALKPDNFVTPVRLETKFKKSVVVI